MPDANLPEAPAAGAAAPAGTTASPGGPLREWVVGFLFDGECILVVLIRKNRPAWQAGKLNGVGGRVEITDLSLGAAMRREFLEETGVDVDGWQRFASLTWEEGVVHFFRCFANRAVLSECRSVTDERVELHTVHSLGIPGPGRDNVTPNLLWLVPLAAHRHDQYDVVDVVELGTTLRKPGRLDVYRPDPSLVVTVEQAAEVARHALDKFIGLGSEGEGSFRLSSEFANRRPGLNLDGTFRHVFE